MWLALKAESLMWADRTSEALEAIKEAAALAKDLKWLVVCRNCTDSAGCFSRPSALTSKFSKTSVIP